jgi:hypothetical protein
METLFYNMIEYARDKDAKHKKQKKKKEITSILSGLNMFDMDIGKAQIDAGRNSLLKRPEPKASQQD